MKPPGSVMPPRETPPRPTSPFSDLDGRVDEERDPPGFAAKAENPRQHQARLGQKAANVGKGLVLTGSSGREGRPILQPQPPEIDEMQRRTGRAQPECKVGRKILEQIGPSIGPIDQARAANSARNGSERERSRLRMYAMM